MKTKRTNQEKSDERSMEMVEIDKRKHQENQRKQSVANFGMTMEEEEEEKKYGGRSFFSSNKQDQKRQVRMMMFKQIEAMHNDKYNDHEDTYDGDITGVPKK